MVDNKEVLLKWIPASYQLADVMTKRGVSTKPLVEVLSEACIDIV